MYCLPGAATAFSLLLRMLVVKCLMCVSFFAVLLYRDHGTVVMARLIPIFPRRSLVVNLGNAIYGHDCF
jgi:hypothetical protein